MCTKGSMLRGWKELDVLSIHRIRTQWSHDQKIRKAHQRQSGLAHDHCQSKSLLDHKVRPRGFDSRFKGFTRLEALGRLDIQRVSLCGTCSYAGASG